MSSFEAGNRVTTHLGSGTFIGPEILIEDGVEVYTTRFKVRLDVRPAPFSHRPDLCPDNVLCFWEKDMTYEKELVNEPGTDTGTE